MDLKTFHKSFKINGISFTTVDEILRYSCNFSDDTCSFLKNWFSEEDRILVKTSGSTGIPKIISLLKSQMINSALATGKYFDLKENTTALLCLPVAYIAGKMMFVRAITLGWHLDVIESNSHPLKDIEKEYDFAAMVPLQLENSLSKINLIKQLIVGGGVVSNTLQDKLQHISTRVFATYGMTETITHIAVKKLNNFSCVISSAVEKSQHESFENTFYQTLPNVTIYKDQRNCLVIAAPKVSKEVVFTNDVVNLISDTQFEWLGRFDNVINSGGIKLHPEKIEEQLSKIITSRFFVTGISDGRLGEKLILVVEQNDDDNVISSSSNSKNLISNEVEKSLISKISNLEALSKFEIPKEIHFIKHFIETETGKIQRKKTLAKIFPK